MCRVEGLQLGHTKPRTRDAGQCRADALAAQHRRATRGLRQLHQAVDPPSVKLDHPPNSGSSIIIDGAFATTLSDLWIQDVYSFVTVRRMANTVTILDSIMYNAWGSCGMCIYGGGNSSRVDIVQVSRVTANNAPGQGNRSTVWIDIGSGVNTVRLDNVGLINGGTGVRMSSPQDSPAGETPGRPLFLLANDLEIDFPCGNAIELLEGEEAQISNGYIQGAGSDIQGAVPDATKGVGLLVGPRWNSEVMVTNSRFFGHYLSAVELQGGSHTLLANNIISASSLRHCGVLSAVLVRSNVSDFILQGNHIGNVFGGPQGASMCTRFGVEIEPGVGDRFVVATNTLFGNQRGGLSDLSAPSMRKVVHNNAVPGDLQA